MNEPHSGHRASKIRLSLWLYALNTAGAWDCLVYSIAVSELVTRNPGSRELELRSSKSRRKKPVMIENEYLKQRTGYRNLANW
ncbi:MAG: hypothetical protein OXH47_10175 [Paracoccaceae bacterium]|nr:hypothetical protein [Paracoccaceae bacterium]